jgi:uncharacterized protein (DUF849 family)
MPRGLEKPVIIEAAINGPTSKLENPRVPWHDAQRCLAAGAAIVHNHVKAVMVDGPTAMVRRYEQLPLRLRR